LITSLYLSAGISSVFYNYEGDNKGKIVPYTPIANEFNLTQEYDDVQYDNS